MSVVIFAIVVLAVVYGLQCNHARQVHLDRHPAGSTDVHDRDTERVIADLRAAANR